MPDVNQMRRNPQSFDPRLFLRDEELDYGIALVLAGERTLIRQAGELALENGLPALASRTLIALRFEPGLTVSVMRAQMGATVPTFARIIADLGTRGLIERRKSERDGRARTLFLTTDGKRLTDPAAIAMRDALRDAYRKAGATAVAGARSVLEAL